VTSTRCSRTSSSPMPRLRRKSRALETVSVATYKP
jgi:hypothetical protein